MKLDDLPDGSDIRDFDLKELGKVYMVKSNLLSPTHLLILFKVNSSSGEGLAVNRIECFSEKVRDWFFNTLTPEDMYRKLKPAFEEIKLQMKMHEFDDVDPNNN